MDKTELERVQRYLRTLFNNPQIKIAARAKTKDVAEVFLGEEFIATLDRDEEDGELSYHFRMTVRDTDAPGYLRTKFGNPQFKVVPFPKSKDTSEVYLGEESIGTLTKDEEGGKLSQNFRMAIFDTDLE